MKLSKIIPIVRSHYPKLLGIRRTLQTIKVQRITRYTLPNDQVSICEQDHSKIAEIIKPYMEKYESYLSPIIEEANYLIERAPKYSGLEDQEKKRIKEDMLFCRLAYGFIPSEYTGFAFENRVPEERKKFVSDLDISVFGYTVNDIVEIQKILDKAKMVRKFSNYLKRDVLLISSTDDWTAFERFVSNHPIFVKKKTFSCKGKGVELVDLSKADETANGYFDRIIKEGTWLLEECVIQSAEMAAFNSSSVNTIRVRTFKTRNGVDLRYCNLRTGRNGSFVDNGGSGGLLIGVNEKTGIVNTDGYDEFGEAYEEHPDSHVRFRGYQIPDWEELRKICIQGAEENPDMGYLSWDMAHTDDGWKVIEVNEVGQFVGAQLISGRGLKKELEAYKKAMKKFIW